MKTHVALIVLTWSLWSTDAYAGWIKIGPGPNLDYAVAHFDNASKSVDRPLPERNNIVINVNPYGQYPYYGNPNALSEGMVDFGPGWASPSLTQAGWENKLGNPASAGAMEALRIG